jgi:Fe-S-cluster containining protein
MKSIITCKSCKDFECCKDVGFPFVLTEMELIKIAKWTGIRKDEFATKVEYGCNNLWFLRRNEIGHCFFFDGEEPCYKKCKIYPIRPLDCRLFPLDVDLRNGVFILIKYDFCHGSEGPVENQVFNAKKRILPSLKKELHEYAELRTELYEKGHWGDIEILDPLKYRITILENMK